MSRYLRLLNKIRSGADGEWLTPGQRAAYETLGARLPLHEVINLYGGHGVGKTFLAWVLQRTGLPGVGGVTHCSSLSHPLENAQTPVLILDHVAPERDAIREAVRTGRYAGYRAIILLTTLPARDQIDRVELTLSAEDRTVVASRLTTLDAAFVPSSGATLWDLWPEILPELR